MESGRIERAIEQLARDMKAELAEVAPDTGIAGAVYVLTLQHDKFYVGSTATGQRRLLAHIAGDGSGWTRKHAVLPDRMVRQFFVAGSERDLRATEMRITLALMHEHGVDNVRGGAFVETVLSSETKRVIERLVAYYENVCYRCFESGHYASECHANQEPLAVAAQFSNIRSADINALAGRESPVATAQAPRKRSRADADPQPITPLVRFPNNKQTGCTYCGHGNHKVGACFATRDINNTRITQLHNPPW